MFLSVFFSFCTFSISCTIQARYGNLEPLDDIDYTLPSKVHFNNHWDDLKDFDEDNRIDGPLAQPLRPYDLSNDININYILGKKNIPINPDSEFISSSSITNPIDRKLARDFPVEQSYVPKLQSRKSPFEKLINHR